jgi:tRNA pseudouridine55 synthase
MALFLIDKQAGVTSADIVHEVKKLTGAAKVGHGGTLDPFATGLLIVATNEHTRLLGYLLGAKKTYEGIIEFGKSTTTFDPEGDIVYAVDDVDVNEEEVSILINKKFIGKIVQRPPIYSAVRVNGRKAYELAREGVEFELDPVVRQIYDFKVEKLTPTDFTFIVDVSSGTYIRALANDIGEQIGVPSMLKTLRRLKIGNNEIKDASILPELRESSIREVFGFESEIVSDIIMKSILDGKHTEIILENKPDLFIAVNGTDEILVKRNGYRYKIVKRLK